MFDADAIGVNRFDFLNSTGVWNAANSGLNDVDLWIGGLAEAQQPFGGLLGSTFNFVFETQMEALQDGDRFYYLARLAGTHFLTELEGNSFAQMVMNNTDLGAGGMHLPGDIFSVPNWILEVDQTKQVTGLGPRRECGPNWWQHFQSARHPWRQLSEIHRRRSRRPRRH